jgi:hypothetical protein
VGDGERLVFDCCADVGEQPKRVKPIGIDPIATKGAGGVSPFKVPTCD